MSRNDLGNLARNLDLSIAVVRGIARSEGKQEDAIIANSAARACAQIALRAGYPSKEVAEKNIRATLSAVYILPSGVETRIRFFMRAHEQAPWINLPPFRLALSALASSDIKGFSALVARYPRLLGAFTYATGTDDAMVDALAARSPKYRRNRTSRRLITAAAFEKAVKQRLRRWGSVSSLYWQAALQLNPKVRQTGLVAARKKQHNHTQGVVVKTAKDRNGVLIEIEHHADRENPRFYKRLENIIKSTTRYWAEMAGKQIVAHKQLGKLLS